MRKNDSLSSELPKLEGLPSTPYITGVQAVCFLATDHIMPMERLERLLPKLKPRWEQATTDLINACLEGRGEILGIYFNPETRERRVIPEIVPQKEFLILPRLCITLSNKLFQCPDERHATGEFPIEDVVDPHPYDSNHWDCPIEYLDLQISTDFIRKLSGKFGPPVREASTLIPITDATLARVTKLDGWPKVDAIHILKGYEPPNEEDIRFLTDHKRLHEIYLMLLPSMLMETFGKRIEIAGQHIFMASPQNWVEWARSKDIAVDAKIIQALVKVDPESDRHPEPRSSENSRSQDHIGTLRNVQSDATQTIDHKSRRGRLAKYDWPAFEQELIALFDQNGPLRSDAFGWAQQAHVIQKMQDWCSSTWDDGEDNIPHLSTIRAKVREFLLKNPRYKPLSQTERK